jgi:hypothetical protein
MSSPIYKNQIFLYILPMYRLQFENKIMLIILFIIASIRIKHWGINVTTEGQTCTLKNSIARN